MSSVAAARTVADVDSELEGVEGQRARYEGVRDDLLRKQVGAGCGGRESPNARVPYSCFAPLMCPFHPKCAPPRT